MARGPKPEGKSHTTLDFVENYIGTDLDVDLGGWVRFRHRINTGSHSSHLKFANKKLATKGKKEAYLDTGKGMYEIVSSLGMARLTLDQLAKHRANSSSNSTYAESFLEFLRQAKLFYFLMGGVTDNLARIVYTLRHKNSHKRGKEQKKRRKMGFGSTGLKKEMDAEIKKLNNGTITLADCRYTKYRFMYGTNVSKVLAVRHFLTHVWCPFTKIIQREFYWPIQIWSERVYAWPHDQLEAKAFTKLTFEKVVPRMEKDFLVIEKLVDQTFKQLVKDVPDFELTYGATIPPIVGGVNRKRK